MSHQMRWKASLTDRGNLSVEVRSDELVIQVRQLGYRAGPSPGSVEGIIYTIFPIRLQLFGMTEVLAQSLLLSVILCYWVNHPESRWFPRYYVRYRDLTMSIVAHYLIDSLALLGALFGVRSG